MDNSKLKGLHYDPHAAFAKATVQDCGTLKLPEELMWATNKVHPLLLSVLLPYLDDNERFTIGIGENVEGLFLSVYDDREDEVMRMTAHLNRVGKASGWLGDRRTNAGGIWVMGGDSFESPPYASPMTRRSPFHDMRNVLKAVQVFGDDKDLDIQHRGTYVEHSLGRPSRVTEHYTLGDLIWTLTHRPARWCHPTMDYLTLSIDDRASVRGDSIVVRNTYDDNSLETTYFFSEDEDYGRDGAVLEEDACIIIDNDCSGLQHGVPLLSETDPIYLNVMKNPVFAGEDNRVGLIAEQLVVFSDGLKVSHLPSSLNERYQTFIVSVLGGQYKSDKMYRVRVRQ